jgi:undecaprenol kinase/diacylglycerol kinase (ATP)
MLRKKWRNLISAIAALGYLWREELSFRIQVLGGLATFALAYFLHISPVEWLFVVLVTGAIVSTEAINTAIEEICDALIDEHHPRVGRIKDVGALASALIGFAALVIGLIIFVPKLFALL